MKILIVDDDPGVVASLGLLLEQEGFEPLTAASPESALAQLDSASLVLQDMNFSPDTSGDEGLSLLESVRQRDAAIPVILMTAWGSIGLAVEGMKRGASDFVTKPWSNAQLLQSIRTALALRGSGEETAGASRDELDARLDLAAIVGHDPKLIRVLELIGRIAPTDASVLITGPSGTGKELIAEAIHRNSRRRGGPFVKVNLGGISSTLFESEMFGHVRGAFTDAREARRGRFEMADGGTIFLDEIGEVDLNAQVKLLRVLQDRTFEVLGSSRPRTADVRVISATNRDLPAMVRDGRFREDLLYRLNLITVSLPALSERQGDIPVLARHYVQHFARAYGRDETRISPAAIEWLRSRRWPGNIRELRQVIERTMLIGAGEVLDVADFRAAEELSARDDAGTAQAIALPAAGSMTLDEIEHAMIEKCIRHYGGNLTRVAEALGLSRGALYRRMEKYGIEASG